jgi:hypothetical protein
MRTVLLAGMACVAGMAAAWAQDAARGPVPEGRSAAWRQLVAAAAIDSNRLAEAVLQTPEADRAAFVQDVLALVYSKPVTKKALRIRACAAAAAQALQAAGTGAGRQAVFDAVAGWAVGTAVHPESRELAATSDLSALLLAIESQAAAGDRVPFAASVLRAVASSSTADEASRKLALSTAALALVGGAGDRKVPVIATVFCDTPTNGLAAVTAALADAFGQRRNQLSNENYQQIALGVLTAVANCAAGKPDAGQRFAFAVAAFVEAAVVPAAFEQSILGRIPAEQLVKVGLTPESLATAVQTARRDMGAEKGILAAVQKTAGARPVWGVIILPPGTMLAGEQGPPFVHENRPPGYQNQGIR